jgi:hypothetical protein
MGLIELVVVLIIIGLLLWLVESQLPIDPGIKMVIRAIVLIVVVLWLVRLFLGDVALPRLR